MYFIQSTFYDTFSCYTTVFFHQIFLKRSAVYTYTNRDISCFRTVYYCFYAVCTSNITWIDTDLVSSVFHSCNRQTVVKMDICH